MTRYIVRADIPVSADHIYAAVGKVEAALAGFEAVDLEAEEVLDNSPQRA